MKTALPKEVLAFTSEIRAKRQAIERHRADIERAGAAAREAERLEGELAALSDKRARIKALAFIANAKANIAELDKQESELENASRRAREDGKAGALAVQLLEEKIADAEAEIGRLEEQRKAAVLEWLAVQRESAIDKYLDALRALGPSIADALAVEAARRRIVGGYFSIDDPLGEVKVGVNALPKMRGKWEKRAYAGDIWFPAPIDWATDPEHGKRERDQLFAALTDAEVL